MKNSLSSAERALLVAQHKKERDKRICDRIKAILLYDNGWTLMQIAEVLLITDGAVRQYIRDFQDSKKLKPNNGGSCEKLSLQQSRALEDHLKSGWHIRIFM